MLTRALVPVQKAAIRMKGMGLQRWFEKGFWAVSDQGVYGASNFILNILLARWLSEEGYGVFATAFVAFVLARELFNALVVEPMLVFGPKQYRNRFSEYIGVLTYGQLGFAVVMSLVFIPLYALVVSGTPGVSSAGLWLIFLGLALAAPFMLFMWMMRRACYASVGPRVAVQGGCLYTGASLLGIGLLYYAGMMSIFLVFCVMGLASLIGSLWLARSLGMRWGLPDRTFLREVVVSHWRYGRWAAASRVPLRLPGQVILIVLPIWGGLAATGTFKALVNLTFPVLEIFGALGILLIPTLARTQDPKAFRRLTHILLVLFMAGGAAYALVLGLFGEVMVGWLYDGKYADHAGMLWVLGGVAVTGGASAVLGAALRANERPDDLFWSSSVSAGIMVPVILGLVAFFGLEGAIVGHVLLGVTLTLAMWVFYRRFAGRRAHVRPAVRPKEQPEPVVEG